jgi:ankyrin repeat protein
MEEATREEFTRLMQLDPNHEDAEFREHQERFKELIEAYPHFAREKWDYIENYPIHLAAALSSSPSVVKAVFNAYPEALKEKNYHGFTPLHLACQNNQLDQVIQWLVEIYPEAAKEKDTYLDQMPLHLACHYNQSEEVIQSLLEAYPEAAREKTVFAGCMPLHLACESNESDQVIHWLLEAYPEAVKEKDYRGRMPVHYACCYYKKNKSNQVIQRLLDGYVEAVTEKDDGGKTPLYLVCQNFRFSQSDQAIRRMLREAWIAIKNNAIDEDAVFNTLAECCGFWEPHFRLNHMKWLFEEVPISFETMSTNDTKLCLDHLFSKSFVYYDRFWEKLNLIMTRLSTEVARQEELAGRTFLLHSVLELLCRVGIRQDPFENNDASQTISFFLRLVQQHSPDQIRLRDESGSLPLHIAAQLPFDHTRTIIKFLLHEYPEAAGVADGQGRLPLHIAMECGQPCADLLLDAARASSVGNSVHGDTNVSIPTGSSCMER